MPRYLIERVFGDLEEEAMQNIGQRMKRIAEDEFPDITCALGGDPLPGAPMIERTRLRFADAKGQVSTVPRPLVN